MEENDFIRLSKRQQRKLPIKEYIEYKKRERIFEYYSREKIKGFFTSKIWHFILVQLLRVMRLVKHWKYTIISDNRVDKSKPVVYACTHIGYRDIIMTFSALKSHCWLFLGNPDINCRTLDGWMAEKNGVVYIDTYDKQDRKMAKLESVRLLKQGGSLLIFPEGAWNITDNEIVMKLYRGTVDIALESGVDIVPIAIEQYGNHFYLNIGKNISFANSTLSSDELTKDLRDILATLKWEIWEKMGITKRSTLSSDYKQKFVDDILSEAGYVYTTENINSEKYIDKSVTDYETAFKFMNTLLVKKENAFLFRKR